MMASWSPTPAIPASGPATLIELNGAGQTYLRAAGSLGWAFPASLGAKCAAGKRKVICWSGDGAIYYHLTELETARRRGIAMVLVINNNSGFGQGWPNIQRQQGNKPGDVRSWCASGRPISPMWRACSACAASASRSRRRSHRH